MKRVIITIIFIAALICFGYSAFSLGKYAWQTHVTKENISILSGMVNKEAGTSAAEGEDADPRTDAEKMMDKYGELYKSNPDFMGWLTVPGTAIDNPVMYTPDDGQHYLRKNFNGDYDIAGMIFIDERCKLDPADHVSTDIIIYGHRMKNDTMFGPLKYYKEKDFCKENNIVYFDTMYRPGTYVIFAAFLGKAYTYETDAFQYYNFIEAPTEVELNDYLTNIKAIAHYYDEENAPVFGDEIITLSTCDYYTNDGRLALLAKRIGGDHE